MNFPRKLLVTRTNSTSSSMKVHVSSIATQPFTEAIGAVVLLTVMLTSNG